MRGARRRSGFYRGAGLLVALLGAPATLAQDGNGLPQCQTELNKSEADKASLKELYVSARREMAAAQQEAQAVKDKLAAIEERNKELNRKALQCEGLPKLGGSEGGNVALDGAFSELDSTIDALRAFSKGSSK
jgi:hypothetical protein